MIFRPITMREANAFIQDHHRHSKPVRGCKFVLGLEKERQLIGVGVVGRPVSRMADDGLSAEITRVCIKEGNPTACSKMYARLTRLCYLMGFKRVFTYTLQKESQSSMKALGAVLIGEVEAKEWTRKSRPRDSQPVYQEPKLKWAFTKSNGDEKK